MNNLRVSWIVSKETTIEKPARQLNITAEYCKRIYYIIN